MISPALWDSKNKSNDTIITKNSRRVYLRGGFQHKQQIIFDLQTEIFDMACGKLNRLEPAFYFA
jgi:hypothetical protein